MFFQCEVRRRIDIKVRELKAGAHSFLWQELEKCFDWSNCKKFIISNAVVENRQTITEL